MARYPTAGPPVTQEERDRVAALHAAGMSRNDIARAIKRSSSTVSAIAKSLGLSFARTPEVAAATEARKADARKLRSRLIIDLLADAYKLRGQLWSQTEYIAHGGKEFVEVRWTQDEPTPRDKRDLMAAVGVAVEKSLRMEEHDAATSNSDGPSILADLAGKLKVAWDRSQEEAGNGDA